MLKTWYILTLNDGRRCEQQCMLQQPLSFSDTFFRIFVSHLHIIKSWVEWIITVIKTVMLCTQAIDMQDTRKLLKILFLSTPCIFITYRKEYGVRLDGSISAKETERQQHSCSLGGSQGSLQLRSGQPCAVLTSNQPLLFYCVWMVAWASFLEPTVRKTEVRNFQVEKMD